ncbi:phenylacetaldoxime dehydratase [Sphaerulina musiva SO2202]|uniref:Phenylacetaldoxime dehydratase n=1 Tax=Sphaerulina musiva (strain SO2202) TaxID=692275 RepID=M3B660_SPHMS|nr:phenylacetaldoxime dehydratase [Sphaerulina musiva SO2202]EMF15297.1 phenylacetaldoxime dehydratase [Sphaerulina musiva SO2202]
MAETRVLENAIPIHLQTTRTIPAKTPANYMPPFPAYTARFPKEAKDLVMAIIGVQHETPIDPQGTDYQKLVDFVANSPESSRPKYWEAAAVTDNRGFQNEVVIPYWQNKADYDRWRLDSGFAKWWADLQVTPDRGWFLEVFLPSMDRFETVFSDNAVPEGAANMRVGVSGEMQQHVYWGSMRDRMAAAQTDPLIGEKAFPNNNNSSSSPELADKKQKIVDTRSQRIHIPGRPNLAMIRSGQDWSNTTPHERSLYLDTMHPVLTKGMTFLRDHGSEVGCISNRFMTCTLKNPSSSITTPHNNTTTTTTTTTCTTTTTTTTTTTDRTFGLAYFDDLTSLEGWSKQHRTHLDIFARFLSYAAELQNQVSLRLFHEVMVLKPEQQFFEYVGCHDGTGMLRSFL